MEYLKDHPQIAIISAITSAIAPYIEGISKIAQFIAVVGGALIVVVTLYLKIQEVKELRRKRRLKNRKDE